MIVPFDQYQRYQTLSDIVKRIKEHSGQTQLKVLEIGANEQRNLEKFLPDEDIYYSDITLPEHLLADPKFFIADATNLEGIEDNSFDVVVAGDVFEHIPKAGRKDFLKETARVARYASVLCFPFAAPHVEAAEQRANEYFKTICGEDYIWLFEHIDNGLPGADVVDGFLGELGLCYSRFEHGDIRMWEEMTKCHFYTCFMDKLIPYREEIDKYYNENVYCYDTSDENYRNFYIVFKDEAEQGFFDQIAKEIFTAPPAEAKLYEDIKKLCKEVKEIFELRQRLWLQETQIKNRDSYGSWNGESLVGQEFSAYYDMGEGYSIENMKMRQALMEGKNTGDQMIRIDVPAGCKKLRFDPLEGSYCVIKNLDVLTNCGVVNYKTNGFTCGEYIIFATDDPTVEIEIGNLPIAWVGFRGEVYLLREKNIQQLLVGSASRNLKNYAELQEKSARLDMQSQELQREREQRAALEADHAAQNERLQQLEAQYQDVLAHYNRIVGSKAYRLTKPVRLCARGTKKLLKSNKYTYKMARGVKCAKENGMAYTYRKTKEKVKNKLGKSQTAAVAPQPVVTSQQLLDFENSIELEPIPEDIKFSILVPLYNTEERFLRAMIESVLIQRYGNWELCLADGSTPEYGYVEKVCMEYAQKDSRIRYNRLTENRGISGNTNACAEMATGQYIVLFDHDDYMSSLALYENARAIYATDADVLYSDEDHVTEDERHVFPLYKPDWSRDLLYSQMYVCHLFVFKKSLFEKIGGFRKEFDGSQDYDLMLRFSQETERILHIPKRLYSWRECSTSTAVNAQSKPYAHFAGLNALNDHLKQRYGEHAYANETENLFVFETRFDTMKDKPLVSIIMPMKDHWDMSRDCVDSILEKSTYENYEILILDNRSEQPDTFRWFEQVQQKDSRVKVLRADMEFNWSKLNNFGIRHAKGDVFIFMNNDMKVISPDWMERLCENALREEIGVVGPMLLFEDDTIQHAGIVVGFGGWADHVFRGMEPVHCGSPYVSPMVSRNVTAVTGACMAISRETIETIGDFDDSFIICGSDVEICIRAYEMGFNNLYNSRAKLYHLESKSRDASKIPEIDFKRSYECYTPYRENGDPFYNPNLDYNSIEPREREDKMNLVNVRDYLKHNRITGPIGRKVKKFIIGDLDQPGNKIPETRIPEIEPLNGRPMEELGDTMRLNILSPSVDKMHVFGGISTALKFYEALGAQLGCPVRIIVTDAPVVWENAVQVDGYKMVPAEENSMEMRQVVPFCDRAGKTFPVGKNDIFLATAWWTAYTISEVMKWQADYYKQPVKPMLYMVQDYEPGFYPWSSRYLMADSTYKMDIPTVAILNSTLLKDHFENNGYQFARSYSFDPVLNETLKEYLFAHEKDYKRKKQILIYGRPSVERNALELIVASLKEWAKTYPEASEWTILSAGESFADIPVDENISIQSIGKLSLEDYGRTMLETSIGISLMVSPHPSYPPLEMSTFGIRTITNCYGSKDLGSFNENMISVKNCSQGSICAELTRLCETYSEEGVIGKNDSYLNNNNIFGEIVEDLASYLKSC